MSILVLFILKFAYIALFIIQYMFQAFSFKLIATFVAV